MEHTVAVDASAMRAIEDFSVPAHREKLVDGGCIWAFEQPVALDALRAAGLKALTNSSTNDFTNSMKEPGKRRRGNVIAKVKLLFDAADRLVQDQTKHAVIGIVILPPDDVQTVDMATVRRILRAVGGLVPVDGDCYLKKHIRPDYKRWYWDRALTSALEAAQDELLETTEEATAEVQREPTTAGVRTTRGALENEPGLDLEECLALVAEVPAPAPAPTALDAAAFGGLGDAPALGLGFDDFDAVDFQAIGSAFQEIGDAEIAAADAWE